MNIDQAKATFKSGVVYKTNLCAISYCNTPIQVKGFMIVNIHYKNANFKLNLYLTNVVRPPLLGCEWMRQLGMFPFDDSKMEKGINIVEQVDKKVEIEKLFEKYPNVLKEDMSPIRDHKATLTSKEGAKPVFMKARRVPFKLIPLIEAELDALENKNIIEKVYTSKFATPIVPVLKKNNTVRICGDFSITVNPQLIVDEYHLSTTDELLADMAGCRIFAKIDLS